MSFPNPDTATPEEIREMLTLPSDFGISSEHPVSDDPEHWTLGPRIRSRDSDLLEEINAGALEAALRDETRFEGAWTVTHCGHWACGWVDHLSFRLLDAEGNPTAIWRWLAEWYGRLEDYPCADDTGLSRREYAGALDNIRDEGRGQVRDEAPDDWPQKVWAWLWDNMQRELEATDGRAPYPSWEAVGEALKALSFYAADDS